MSDSQFKNDRGHLSFLSEFAMKSAKCESFSRNDLLRLYPRGSVKSVVSQSSLFPVCGRALMMIPKKLGGALRSSSWRSLR